MISVSAQFKIPSRKYVKNFGVNGRTESGKKEYLLRLNVVGQIELSDWAMNRLRSEAVDEFKVH